MANIGFPDDPYHMDIGVVVAVSLFHQSCAGVSSPRMPVGPNRDASVCNRDSPTVPRTAKYKHTLENCPTLRLSVDLKGAVSK